VLYNNNNAFRAAGIPVKKEKAGLVQSDGKYPDSCTFIPWRGGRPLAWDVTVCTMVAASYLTAASNTAGAVTEQAADKKCSKYTELSSTHKFQPVAVRVIRATEWHHGFFSGRIRPQNYRPFMQTLQTQFLFQKGSTLVQHFSTILFWETLQDDDNTDT